MPAVMIVLTSCFALILQAQTREEIQQDLVLDAEINGPNQIEAGAPVPLAVHLLNRSGTTAYPVVKTGDGSEAGWREPHVYFTGEFKGVDGKWTSLGPQGIARCGVYDSAWQDDVVMLEAGQKLALNAWLPNPQTLFELQQPGEVRLQVHYSYGAGRNNKANESGDEEFGKMKGIPEFELVSAPVQFGIIRPIDLMLLPQGELKPEETGTLSEVLEVLLINRSDETRQLPMPTITSLSFMLQGQNPGWRPVMELKAGVDETLTLKPGEQASLLGPHGAANGLDWMWTWQQPAGGSLKIRAVYIRQAEDGPVMLKSNRVELSVRR